MNLVEIIEEQSVFVQDLLLEGRTGRWSSGAGGLNELLLGHYWRAVEADNHTCWMVRTVGVGLFMVVKERSLSIEAFGGV